MTEPVTDVIRRRFSCRTYTRQPFEGKDRGKLSAFVSKNRAGPFGTSPQFRLIAATSENMAALKSLSTYGFIRGASGFIIGAVKDVQNNLEDYGYLMEANILYATRIGLGTCWLGGIFNKSTFSKAISMGENESVPAVAATGYIAAKRTVIETVVRWGAGADNRKPWEALFFQNDFNTPLPPKAAGEWAEALEMVRLGPSASNRQPWRIVRDKNAGLFHFYLQRAKGYAARNSTFFGIADLQRVDMGIAMCHFEMTLNEAGKKGEWRRVESATGPLPELTEYLISWIETPS